MPTDAGLWLRGGNTYTNDPTRNNPARTATTTAGAHADGPIVRWSAAFWVPAPGPVMALFYHYTRESGWGDFSPDWQPFTTGLTPMSRFVHAVIVGVLESIDGGELGRQRALPKVVRTGDEAAGDG
jgi:hypothetical protein